MKQIKSSKDSLEKIGVLKDLIDPAQDALQKIQNQSSNRKICPDEPNK